MSCPLLLFASVFSKLFEIQIAQTPSHWNKWRSEERREKKEDGQKSGIKKKGIGRAKEMDDLSVCATLEDEPKEKVPSRIRRRGKKTGS